MSLMTKRKPPKRKKSNVVYLEEYCLKKINESPLSKKFYYENFEPIIMSGGGYGTEYSLESLLDYMKYIHKGAKIGCPYLIPERMGWI
jgi:hypothetical protein